MRSTLTIDQFFKQFGNKLKLSYLSKKVGLDSEIKLSTHSSESYQAVDFFNIIRPSSILLIGHQESKYISTLSREQQLTLFSQLYSGPTIAIIVSSKEILSEWLIQLSEAHSVPVFYSELIDSELLELSRYLLNRALAEHVIEHGVFIEVYSVGIFITGDSGIGKSELALALIAKGHRLIADDVTRFVNIAPDVLDGHSPNILTDFMEVRGLGILNIRAMFGSNSIKRNKTLRLIIQLSKYTEENKHKFDRLGLESQTQSILGIEIPKVTLPIASGRNIAVLVEAAARNHLLSMNGYNAAEDLIERQQNEIINN